MSTPNDGSPQFSQREQVALALLAGMLANKRSDLFVSDTPVDYAFDWAERFLEEARRRRLNDARRAADEEKARLVRAEKLKELDRRAEAAGYKRVFAPPNTSELQRLNDPEKQEGTP
jgi:hypothetical protein